MGDLRLYAIGIDEVRDILGADAGLREELRTIADEAFAPPQPVAQPVGLLGKLGPLFRRPVDAPVIPANHPVPDDFEALTNGHWISPDRLVPTWRLFETLVARRSWGTIRLPVDEHFLNQLDFDLARAGSPASLGLAAFLRSDARIGLTTLPGLQVCYRVNAHAIATAEEFSAALPQIGDERSADAVRVLVNWLNGFAHWSGLAPDLGRPAPDLLGFWADGSPGPGR